MFKLGGKMNEINLKNNLKDIRIKNNMSQESLAQMVGTSRQTIIAIEKNIFCPTAKLAFLLCTALDVNFEELFYVE